MKLLINLFKFENSTFFIESIFFLARNEMLCCFNCMCRDNFSEVKGKFHKKFRSQILGAKKNPNYWASGISVVAHMKNPKIPALHFNTRFIVTSKNWFGGGMDATPCIQDKKEKDI